MSWSARRYTNPDIYLIERSRELKTSRHHVPPRNPAKKTPFIVRKSITDHRAYHQLFRNAATFEQACEILLVEWWTPPSKNDNWE